MEKERYTQDLLDLIQDKCPGATPLYLVIRGSHAYGTNLPTSDVDFAGVMVQPIEDILGMSYKEQINDDKNDIVIYEVKRFLELVGSNNPNILELLNTPEDCVLYKHPSFDLILENADRFLTKACANSFGGYARQQITKAKGQDKKQNWEKDKVERKTPLDFCYVVQDKGSGSLPLSDFLSDLNITQDNIGLVNVPNARDMYAMYLDVAGGELKFKGVAGEDSNELRLSSIPKESPLVIHLGHLSYNKDGYTSHCKDYNSYQVWLNNRNESRWVDVKGHGQKIDGKNMMHCKRLMDMSKEIAQGKGVIVRRPDAESLIGIRKGEVDLQSLIDTANEELKEIDHLFKNSNLPDKVDMGVMEDILLLVRKNIYNL